jgi:hypothetical protein
MRAVLAVPLLAAACGGSPPAAPLANTSGPAAHAHEPLASLERTGCFGTCPIYKVTVFRDGAVEYAGEEFVKLTGKATAHLNSDVIDQLDALFQHGYLDLEDTYTDERMTDMPSANTSYTPVGGKPKAIKHYLGDNTAPASLTDVEDGVDRLVHIERWIGTEAERKKRRQ